MERRVEATASPGIDLLQVESRILQLQAELTTARTNKQVAVTRLTQLSGVGSLRNAQTVFEEMQTMQFADSYYAQVRDLDLRDIALTSPGVLLAKGEVEAAKARLQAKRAEKWPNVYVRVDSPLSKPANTSGSNGTTAFVGIRYTPGAGFANLADAEAIALRTDGLAQAIETATRDASELMQNDRDELANARLQITALSRSISGSQAVLESYSRQFQAGRKSWLDLLNAARELVQNEFAMSDTNAAMLCTMHRLQIRTGQNLPTPE
jgi:adhesin transport system outer membrane protein